MSKTGRPPAVTPDMLRTILERHALGVPATVIARQLGIGKTTVFKALKQEREK
ncbi:MAG: helix-turn-helix domain-containing protein [Edwardsiella sp. (in: enterobacteria)]